MDPQSMDNFKKSFNRKRNELGYEPMTTIEQNIAYLAQYAGQVSKLTSFRVRHGDLSDLILQLVVRE
jgi:hypothetical protein